MFAFVAVGGYVTSLLLLPPAQPVFGEIYVLGLNWPFIPAISQNGSIAHHSGGHYAVYEKMKWFP